VIIIKKSQSKDLAQGFGHISRWGARGRGAAASVNKAWRRVRMKPPFHLTSINHATISRIRLGRKRRRVTVKDAA